MEWIDSHCHLDDPRFDPDRAEVVQRARSAGVGAIIVPATTAARWPAVAASCQAGDDIHPAWGLHPMFIADHAPGDLAALEQQVARQRPVAIGECGLDFSKHKTSPGSAFSFHGLAGFAFHLPAGRSHIGQKYAFCRFRSFSAPFTQSAPIPGGLNVRVDIYILFPFLPQVKRFLI
mgnify:CR=1 FL=1